MGISGCGGGRRPCAARVVGGSVQRRDNTQRCRPAAPAECLGNLLDRPVRRSRHVTATPPSNGPFGRTAATAVFGRRHEGMCRVTSRNRLSAAATCWSSRVAAAMIVRRFEDRLARHPQAPGRNFDLAAGLRSIHWTHRSRFAPPSWPVALELSLSDLPGSGPSAGCAETPCAKAAV